MAQGEFAKDEARQTREAFEEVFVALGIQKQMDYIGHANDIYLFLDAAERAAPDAVDSEGDE